jgi:hypothetical protein
MEVFEFRPTPTSPIFGSRRSSWRTSMQSSASVNRATQTDDSGCDFMTARTPISPSSGSMKDFTHAGELCVISQEPDNDAINEERNEATGNEAAGKLEGLELGDDDGFNHVEIADVHVSSGRASAASSFTRPRIVTIPPRRTPPALPPRNPGRHHSPRSSDATDSATQSDGSRRSADTTSSKSEVNQDNATDQEVELGRKQGQEEEQGRKSEPVIEGACLSDAKLEPEVKHDTSLLLPREDSNAGPNDATNTSTGAAAFGLDGEEFHSLPNSPIEK